MYVHHEVNRSWTETRWLLREWWYVKLSSRIILFNIDDLISSFSSIFTHIILYRSENWYLRYSWDRYRLHPDHMNCRCLESTIYHITDFNFKFSETLTGEYNQKRKPGIDHYPDEGTGNSDISNFRFQAVLGTRADRIMRYDDHLRTDNDQHFPGCMSNGNDNRCTGPDPEKSPVFSLY